jgi:hypothetical protein
MKLIFRTVKEIEVKGFLYACNCGSNTDCYAVSEDEANRPQRCFQIPDDEFKDGPDLSNWKLIGKLE